MTRTNSGFEPSVPLAYIETTIPPGMTLDSYRRSRLQRRRRRHRPWHRATGSKTGDTTCEITDALQR